MNHTSTLFAGACLAGVALLPAVALDLPPELAFGPLPDPTQAVARAAQATTNRFPDADTVLVDDLVREAYRPDGTSVMIDDEYHKALTEKGRRALSTRGFYLPTSYSTTVVLRAEIIKPDGRRTPVDLANSRVMVDPGQMGANIYDPNNKVLQLAVPGLEISDTVHITALQTTYKSRVPDTWADLNTFEGDAPIQHFTYEVVAPSNRPLQHIHLRAPVSNTVTATTATLADGRTLHRWEIRDVPQMFPEPDMPAEHTVVQRVLLSTAPDWPALSRWYARLCQPRLEAVTPEMRATVSNLVAGIPDRDGQIRALFTFVSQDVRYMGITTENVAPGYEPHDVCMTFSNRYGVCRDKAALLVAMLRLAGFDAHPVLINVGSKMDAECPVPYFNHAIVGVAKPEGGYLLMDPTNENTRDLFPAYLCNRSYLVANPTGDVLRVSEVPPADRNLVRIRTQGALDDAGTLTLDIAMAFDGINDTAYRGRFLRSKPEERRRFFEGLVKARLPGAEITSFRLTPEALQNTAEPLAAALTCRVRDYPVAGDGVTLLNLPWLGTGIGYVNLLVDNASLETRKYPYVTELACGVDESVAIDCGRAVGTPVRLPPETRIARSGVEFVLTTTLTNRTLTGRFLYLLAQPEFTPAEYADLKQSLRDIEFAARHRPAFAAAAGTQADVRILDDTLRIVLSSPRAWTAVRTTTREILTYAGKKRFAELKMPFNPAWQGAELTAATVSNRNGTVRTVAAQEVNLMDAGWVAGAPRYPAGKIKVVSLPGVEIGSVIRTTVTRTQQDAPFFSLEFPFGAFEPMDATALEITAPRDVPLLADTLHGATLHMTCVTNGTSVVWRWEGGPFPAAKPEEDLPPWPVYRPTVLASAGEWGSYARAFERAFNIARRADRTVQRRAQELVRGLHDPDARIRAIRDEVARAIREDGPSFLDLPLTTLSPAERTLADGYGHAADRAILLVALLRAANIDAEPVLVSAAPRLAPELLDPFLATPQVGIFDRVLVRVNARGRKPAIYLNDGDQYTEPGTTPHDRHPLLSLDGRTSRVSVAPEHRDRTCAEWTLEVAADGAARITTTNWYFGSACGGFRKEYDEMMPEERSRHFQGLVAEISQAARATTPLHTDTLAYPGCRSFAVQAPRYGVREGQTLTLLLPDAGRPPLNLRADRRSGPLLVNQPRESEWICRIVFPAGVRRLPVLPPEEDHLLPHGLGRIVQQVGRETLADGRMQVTIRRTARIEAGVVPADAYPALLEINRRAAHPQMQTLLAEF
jgi:transglutaminase-like putative cysteine protease